MSKDKPANCKDKWEQDMKEPESFSDDDNNAMQYDNYVSEEQDEK